MLPLSERRVDVGAEVALAVNHTLDRRRHFSLPTCSSVEEAEVRRHIIAEIGGKLKGIGKIDLAIATCRQAAAADGAKLADIASLVDGLVRGTERVALRSPRAPIHV